MKNTIQKKVTISFLIVFGLVFYLPLVFANSVKNTPFFYKSTEMLPIEQKISVTIPVSIDNLYDSMELSIKGLSKTAFNYALKGFYHLYKTGKISNDKIITIADFSQPSYKKRLFVIDLVNTRLIYNTYVAHGINSGKVMANQFSNRPESNMSSLGFYETLNTYMGSHGYSLRLEGLEKGINDNANRRDIVIHGANYANEDIIKTQGYLGRSWGCPALPEKYYKPIINTIKNGTCIFVYGNDKNYTKKSKLINT